MSRRVSPTAVGSFVLAMAFLTVLLVLFFSGGNWFAESRRYELLYDTSVKGLNVGAPVTLKGVPIGQVQAIRARMYGDSLEVLNSVVIEVRADALELMGNGEDSAEIVASLIERGLGAQLRLQSLLTGLLYVEADFYPDRPLSFRDIETEYPQIPTIPTDLERLTKNLEAFDIDKLTRNLQETVSGLNQLVNDPALRNLAPALDATLSELRTSSEVLRTEATELTQRLNPLLEHADEILVTLGDEVPQLGQKADDTLAALQQAAEALERSAASTAHLVSEDSPMIWRFNRAARSVEAAADRMRELAETLEQQPQSLLFGKQQQEERYE
ncbi:MAG: MlaD family protein [Spongiibacteraceae bacterium]|jgi:paraquat-inducible protein B|nr:MlaD family protein [Spongiibacteraceae bacterium]